MPRPSFSTRLPPRSSPMMGDDGRVRNPSDRTGPAASLPAELIELIIIKISEPSEEELKAHDLDPDDPADYPDKRLAYDVQVLPRYDAVARGPFTKQGLLLPGTRAERLLKRVGEGIQRPLPTRRVNPVQTYRLSKDYWPLTMDDALREDNIPEVTYTPPMVSYELRPGHLVEASAVEHSRSNADHLASLLVYAWLNTRRGCYFNPDHRSLMGVSRWWRDVTWRVLTRHREVTYEWEMDCDLQGMREANVLVRGLGCPAFDKIPDFDFSLDRIIDMMPTYLDWLKDEYTVAFSPFTGTVIVTFGAVLFTYEEGARVDAGTGPAALWHDLRRRCPHAYRRALDLVRPVTTPPIQVPYAEKAVFVRECFFQDILHEVPDDSYGFCDTLSVTVAGDLCSPLAHRGPPRIVAVDYHERMGSWTDDFNEVVKAPHELHQVARTYMDEGDVDTINGFTIAGHSKWNNVDWGADGKVSPVGPSCRARDEERAVDYRDGLSAIRYIWNGPSPVDDRYSFGRSPFADDFY